MQLFEVRPITFQSALKRALVNAGTFTSVFGDVSEQVARACMDHETATVYRLEVDGDPVAQAVERSLLGQPPLETFGDVHIVRLPASNRVALKDNRVYVGEHMRERLVEGTV